MTKVELLPTRDCEAGYDPEYCSPKEWISYKTTPKEWFLFTLEY